MEKTLQNNEDIQSVIPSAENVPEVKVNKLFNIVTLSYAGFLLAAQIFLLIAMFTGIIAVCSVTYNTAELNHFFIIMIARKLSDFNSIVTLSCISIFSIFWLIVLVTVIIGMIKALIGFFKFIKLGEEYESREVRFGKYVRTVSRSYGNAIALIVGSLAVTPSFTGMGSGVVAFGCIMYLLSSTIVILFKDVLDKDKKFDLFGFIVNVGKKLVMFMLAFLLVANVHESFNVGFNNISRIIYFDNAKLLTGEIYFNIARPMTVFCLTYIAVVAVIAYTVKYYPLNNAKKDVNVLLKKSFITLLVFTLFLGIADCVIYGMAYGADAGKIANLFAENSLAFLFVSVAGIVLTHTSSVEKEEIRG